MPRGPKGEKRPADVIGAAVMVGSIATGEIEEGVGARLSTVRSLELGYWLFFKGC
jgi:hypothetical protein